jgi:hypothetical protein
MLFENVGRKKETTEVRRKNGARGTRDIEGKVTRVGASKSGSERVSIKKEKVRLTDAKTKS